MRHGALLLAMLLVASARGDPSQCSNRTFLLSDVEGLISFPNMTSDGYMCMWQISSSEHNVVGIEFNTSKAALGIGAALHFYVDLARYQNNIPVGSFSYSSPVPAMMVLTSSDEAIIVLHPSTSTQLRRVPSWTRWRATTAPRACKHEQQNWSRRFGRSTPPLRSVE